MGCLEGRHLSSEKSKYGFRDNVRYRKMIVIIIIINIVVLNTPYSIRDAARLWDMRLCVFWCVSVLHGKCGE